MSKYKGREFDLKVIEASNTEPTASKACSKLGIRFTTYRKHAQRLNVWKPNQGGKGTKKSLDREYKSIPINEILKGKHPQFQSGKVKQKLFEAGIKENKCEMCGIVKWENDIIVCQLDHINGNRNDHRLENLRILCPNCHSQTNTYRGRNKIIS